MFRKHHGGEERQQRQPRGEEQEEDKLEDEPIKYEDFKETSNYQVQEQIY